MKKNLLFIFGLIVIVASVISLSASSSSGLLSSKDFIEKYKSTPGAVLVDVRTPAEFEAGNIPGSINIDFENSNFESEVKKLDTSKTYFIYCRSGNRSSKALPTMQRNGIKNIYDLQGGISNAPQLLK